MAVRNDFTAGEVLAAADLNDTFGSKLPYSFGTATPSTTDSGFLWYDSNSTPAALKFWDGSTFQTVVDATWTAYTPTWTSSGTAPAIGNGTLAGRYVKIGKLVVFRMFWKAGSTTTFGTGTYYWSLPVSRSTSGGFATPVVNGHMNDNSLNKYAHVFSVFQPTATEFALASAGDAGTTSAIGQTTPLTWANLDFILLTGTYEAA